MASHYPPINEEEEYYDEEYDDQPNSDDDCLDNYDDWFLFDTDDDEEHENGEDEEEGNPLIDGGDDADVDATSFDANDDEEEREGGEAQGEANELEIDGGEGWRVAEEIAGGGSGAESAAESDRSNSPNCPICFRPWTAEGPHRVCCLPCGHVHGRSCLEIWLQRCGEANGKCPQCNAKFSRQQIINLYAPSIAIPAVRPYEARLNELFKQDKGKAFGRSHLVPSSLREEGHGCAHCSELQERIMDMEAQVSQLEIFQVQNSQLRDLQNEVAELRTEMIEVAMLQGEVAELRSEIDEMRSKMVEAAELQYEVDRLKREMAEVRGVMIDAVDLRGEVDDLKSKIAEMDEEMADAKRMLNEIRTMQHAKQFAKKRRLSNSGCAESGSGRWD